MALSNGSHFSFLTPARSASSGGVRVFDLGDKVPLSAAQRRKLNAVLERIVEHFPAQPASLSTDSNELEDTADGSSTAAHTDADNDGTSH